VRTIAGGILCALVAAIGPAAADPTACPDAIGVVVDPGDQAAPDFRCAPISQGTAEQALDAAGFTFAFRPGFPGMICQIDSVPDPCNGAPAHAYWSLWTLRGGEWTYSRLGAGDATLAAGDITGWAFGAGAPPRLAAADLDAPTAEPLLQDGNATWWGVAITAVLLAAVAARMIFLSRRRRAQT